MSPVQKFRDLPEWQDFRAGLGEFGLDPNTIAEVGEIEGDSLDFVEMTVAFEEAFKYDLKIGRRGKP